MKICTSNSLNKDEGSLLVSNVCNDKGTKSNFLDKDKGTSMSTG